MRTLLLVLWALVSQAAFGAGVYDGIWKSSETTYSTVNQNGNTVIIVGLDLAQGVFSVSQGELVGNELVLTSIIGGNAAITSKVVLQSLTTASVTLLSCTPNPGYICVIPIGTTIVITKVF